MNTFPGQCTGGAAPIFPANDDYSVKSGFCWIDLRNARIRSPCPRMIFRATAAGGPKTASAIGSGIVKQRGTRVILFNGKESHSRSVSKAVSWRILGTLDTFVISWYLTGKVTLAGSIAALEFLTKIIWYYAHERVWASIAWGRGSN